MVKRIVWSNRAQTNRKDILQYWIDRNKSQEYSRKLNKKFIKVTNVLSEYPKLGLLTDYEDVRCKTVGDYRIFYKEEFDNISIISIWDCRKNIDNLDISSK